MADLASFQAQANSIYDPQAAAEKATLTTNYNSGKAASELSKTDANTNYDRALRGVDQNEKTQVDNLNQLYNSRLLGNFSGMQSNALQMLYGKDNQARADLSQNRINMLAKITGQQTAATDRYNTDNSNVDAKFTGEKNKYAGESYNAALKQEETQRRDSERIQQENQRQANSDRQFALSEARFSASEARSGKAESAAAAKKQDMATSVYNLNTNALGKTNVGKDGHVSQTTWNAAMFDWVSQGYDAAEFVKSNFQYVNQNNKGYHGFD